MSRIATRLLISVLVVAPLGASSAGAEMCVLDQVPAATLLLPYFEVTLSGPDRNTIVTIQNATPEPTLLHVTFWTDWGVPTIDFDVYLTGYDFEVFNLYGIFLTGDVPITADQQSDDLDVISPSGDPSWDGDILDCQNFFPYYRNPLITGSNLSRLRDGHTGEAGPAGWPTEYCFGSSSPGLARGYVTFDVSRRCSTEFPHEAGYFDGGDPVAIAANRVIGDAIYRTYDAESGLYDLSTLPLVHVEADPSFDAGSTASGMTFYGRYATGGADHREPLPTQWAAPFHDTAVVTSLQAWRDTGDVAGVFGYLCETGPEALDQDEIVCWNDQEDVVELCSGAACLPLETQRAGVDELSVPWDQGWCRLDLRSTDGEPTQSWLGVVHRETEGAISASPGIALAPACSLD